MQGPAQSLNLRDNGFNVIIGQSKQFKRDWDRAIWPHATAGFFKVKQQIPHILNQLVPA